MSTSLPNDGQRPADRRRTPRYPFAANAEVKKPASDIKLPATVTEIGLNGCYLQMRDPLPAGTPILLKIFSGADFFETAAVVVYAHPGVGMGLEFRQPKRIFLPPLQKWLLEAMRAASAPKP